MHRDLAGQGLPARNDGVAVDRIIFDQSRLPARKIGGDQRGAGAAKHIQHDVAPSAAIANGVAHEGDRFDRWMHGEIGISRGAKAVDPGVIPDVGAVAAGVAQSEAVHMRSGAYLPNEDQLMLGAIETAHPAVGLVPNAEVFQLGKDRVTGGDHLAHVTPVHAHEGNRPFPALCRPRCQRRAQKGGEFDPATSLRRPSRIPGA